MALKEKQYIVDQTLRDMFLLLKRTQELADEMSEQLSGTARDYMVTASHMSECTCTTLFGCAGALHLDLAKWAFEVNKKREGKR